MFISTNKKKREKWRKKKRTFFGIFVPPSFLLLEQDRRTAYFGTNSEKIHTDKITAHNNKLC